MTSDLPTSFDTAETEFSRFLATHAYPPEIVWTSIADVLIDESGHYFIRRNAETSRSASKNRYLSGIGRGLGVELRAICASENQTFACVEVPTDATDAQYRMIGAGLKMSCPVGLFRAGTLVSDTFSMVVSETEKQEAERIASTRLILMCQRRLSLLPDCRQYGHFGSVQRNFRIAGNTLLYDSLSLGICSPYAEKPYDRPNPYHSVQDGDRQSFVEANPPRRRVV